MNINKLESKEINWEEFLLSTCQRCKLHKTRTNVVPAKIVPNCKIMFVAEAPGETEDMFGTEPLIGKAGMLFSRCLEEVGINRNECSIANVVCCRPPNNRNPEKDEIDSCTDILEHDIEVANPEIIVPLGNVALKRIAKHSGITKYNGQIIEHKNYPNKKIIPVVHPSYALRDPGNYDTMKYGLERVRGAQLGELKIIKSKVEYVDTYAKFDKMIKDLSSSSHFAIDIETDSLRDWQKGKIICISFANKIGQSYVLPWIIGDEAFYATCEKYVINTAKRDVIPNVDTFCDLYKLNKPKFHWGDTDVLDRLKQLFANPKIIKILHNYAFDYKFLEQAKLILEPPIVDTMICHYLLDERRGTHGLKKLTLQYTDYGEYADELDKYIKSKKKDDIYDTYAIIPMKILCQYAGTDADVTLQLYRKFAPQIVKEGSLKLLNEFLMPLTQMLMQTEKNGIMIDEKYRQKCEQTLQKSIDKIDAKLAVYSDINFNSTKQLRELLYDKLNLPCFSQTPKGLPSTDESSLSALSKLHEIPKLLLDRRKQGKVLSTYIIGLKNYVWSDGKVHSNFNITGTETGRLSSSNPNCFSKDTEVLTTRGWVKFADLLDDDLVAQYDLHTGYIDFVPPLKKIKYEFDGNLLNVKTKQGIDLLITSDHRCWLKNRKTYKFCCFDAIDYPEDYYQITSGQYLGGKTRLRESQIILICAFQADGHIRKQDGILEFSFSKDRKTQRLCSALDSENIPYRCRIHSKNMPNCKTISISRLDIPEWLSNKKFFGSWILDLNQSSFNFMSEEIFNWDGLHNRKTNYSSSDKVNTDFVQILQILSNKRAKLRVYDNLKLTKPNWQLDICKRNCYLTTNRKISRVPYKDFVYCVTMPKDTVIVRYNGKVAITGQCQNLPRVDATLKDMGVVVRDLYVVSNPADYNIVEVDYSQAELRLIAEYSRDKNLYNAFLQGKDPHAMLAVRLYHSDKIADMELGTINPKDVVTKDERQKGKTANFSLIYGKHWTNFATENNIPEQESEYIYNVFWATYSGVSAWKREVLAKAYQDLYFTSPYFGRKRRFKKLLSPESWVRAEAEREGINFVIQSPASDYTLDSTMKVNKKGRELGYDFKTISFVHDSAVYEVNKKDTNPFLNLLKDIMEHPPEVTVPMEIDVKVGQRLGSLVEWGRKEDLTWCPKI